MFKERSEIHVNGYICSKCNQFVVGAATNSKDAQAMSRRCPNCSTPKNSTENSSQNSFDSKTSKEAGGYPH